MRVVTITTDANRVYLSMDYSITNGSLLLRANSRSPFTLHYALWPFAGLIFLIVTVWFLVYISTILSRRHIAKIEQRNIASVYATQDSTMAGGYESSTVISPADV